MTETITRQGTTYEPSRRGYWIPVEHLLVGDVTRDGEIVGIERAGHTMQYIEGVETRCEVLDITIDIPADVAPLVMRPAGRNTIKHFTGVDGMTVVTPA